MFSSGKEEGGDSPNVIRLAAYVDILLDAHGQARSGLVASSWPLDRAGHSCSCLEFSEQGGSNATVVNPDGDNHTGVLLNTDSSTVHDNPLSVETMDTSEGVTEGNTGRLKDNLPAAVVPPIQAQDGAPPPPVPVLGDQLNHHGNIVGEIREGEILDMRNTRLNISTKMPHSPNYQALRSLLKFVSEADRVLLKGLSRRQARESLAILGVLHSRTQKESPIPWITSSICDNACL